MIRITRTHPEYEHRTEIPCVTLVISMLAREGGDTVITAHLDQGLSTERHVSWKHASDFPVFVFRREQE
jgi:hypothetical protein